MVAVIVAVRAMVIRPVVAVAVAGDRAFAIDRTRRQVAGTGIGRALVDVIVLLLRIGQTLADPAAAGIAARIGRDRRDIDRLCASGVTAGRRGRCGDNGECRDQSFKYLTHYSLLSIFSLVFEFLV